MKMKMKMKKLLMGVVRAKLIMLLCVGTVEGSILYGFDSGVVSGVNPVTGEILSTASIGNITPFAFAPDGILYGFNSGLLRGLDPITGEVLSSVGILNVTPYAFAPDGILYGFEGATLRGLDPVTGEVFSSTGIGNVTPFAFAPEAQIVPVPPAVWLFGSGLLYLIGFARRKA